MRRAVALAFAASLLTTCAPSKRPERAGMVYIPAGEFLMGSRVDDPKVYDWEKSHEQPPHPVRVKGFFIDLHEVTNAEYERFAPGHQRNPKFSPCDDCPVSDVNWFEAQRYCAGQQPPKRLPTEAEWEKAAKGGTNKDPEPLVEYAWCSANSITRTQPVMQKKPNGYGLFDTLGNVREWTADWYGPEYYQERVRDDPTGPAEGQRRVERGGAFFLPTRGVTTTIRYNHPPDFRLYFLGFRCAADGS
jgi:formylglycine-generating enzyme required for sulfatase activity